MQLLTFLHVGHGVELCQEGRIPTINAVMMQGPDIAFRGDSGKGGREEGRKDEIKTMREERGMSECV